MADLLSTISANYVAVGANVNQSKGPMSLSMRRITKELERQVR